MWFRSLGPARLPVGGEQCGSRFVAHRPHRSPGSLDVPRVPGCGGRAVAAARREPWQCHIDTVIRTRRRITWRFPPQPLAPRATALTTPVIVGLYPRDTGDNGPRYSD